VHIPAAHDLEMLFDLDPFCRICIASLAAKDDDRASMAR